jgi:hypothetical protein
MALYTVWERFVYGLQGKEEPKSFLQKLKHASGQGHIATEKEKKTVLETARSFLLNEAKSGAGRCYYCTFEKMVSNSPKVFSYVRRSALPDALSYTKKVLVSEGLTIQEDSGVELLCWG